MAVPSRRLALVRSAASLRPFLNARRVRVGVGMLLRGDLRTVRQRLDAVAAVAGAASGVRVRPDRQLVRVAAEPWPLDEPLVSVVVPCFNYGRYVDEAVASALDQTLGPRVEVLVVEGGSTDTTTRAHLEEVAARGTDRLRVLFRDDGRHLVGDNRNFGIAHARGKLLCCLDADDRLHPVYLEVAAFLVERCGYDLVSTATRCFGAVHDTFGLLPEPDLDDMLRANNVTTAAVFRRAWWERAGGYRDSGLGAEHVHEDWQLWVRLAALGARIRNVYREQLFLYRVHEGESLSRQEGLRGLDWQRQQVRDSNADVVTPLARAASRQARATEVVVEGGLANLLQPETPRRRGLLVVLPFLLLGGAERLLSGLTATLTARGWRVVVVTTHPTLPEFGDATSWFTASTNEVFHLPRLLEPHEWPDFLDHLVGAKQLDVLLQAGSAYLYSALEGLRAQHPHLRVVDLLFNPVGHTRANRQHAAQIDVTVCENREVERWLDQAGADPAGVVRIESGVDLAALTPRARGTSGELLVGFNGRLSEEKDPLAFVALAEAVSRPDIRFVMTGVGQLEKRVRRRVARSSAAIEYLGAPDDVLTHVASLDVLVAPSTLDGRPMAVMEALALGVPVLATRVGALPELVVDGVNGYTCAPGEVSGFAPVLERLAADDALLAGLKAGARRFAEEHLDQRDAHQAFVEVLDGLVDGTR